MPGGYIEYNETSEEACKREAMEETNLKVKVKKLIGVYSDPKRDTRANTISICYLCSTLSGRLEAADDAAEAYWVGLNKLPQKLAFDHALIINDYLKGTKNKV